MHVDVTARARQGDETTRTWQGGCKSPRGHARAPTCMAVLTRVHRTPSSSELPSSLAPSSPLSVSEDESSIAGEQRRGTASSRAHASGQSQLATLSSAPRVSGWPSIARTSTVSVWRGARKSHASPKSSSEACGQSRGGLARCEKSWRGMHVSARPSGGAGNTAPICSDASMLWAARTFQRSWLS